MEWYQIVLSLVILVTLVLSAAYSFRYRRQTNPALRGLMSARMNMSMGVMLIAIALIQAVSFEMSTSRLILATVFALLGLFNLFVGLKNHSYFRSLKP